MIDILKPFRGKYPPTRPIALGLKIQAAGYVCVLVPPAWPLVIPLIYGGGLTAGVPFFLWLVTERRS